MLLETIMSATKKTFIEAYRAALLVRYGPNTANDWAADPIKLDRFMSTCAETLNGTSCLWSCVPTSKVQKAAWAAIGGQGRLSLQALRALP